MKWENDSPEQQEQDGAQPSLFEDRGTFVRKTITTSVMLGGLIGLLALGWYAYDETRQPASGEDIPVIKADATPFKIKPEDPGGMEIPNKDKAVYDVISTSAGTAKTEEKVTLMPEPEEPVAPQGASAPPVPGAAETADPAASGAPDNVKVTVVPPQPEDKAEQPAAAPKSTENNAEKSATEEKPAAAPKKEAGVKKAEAKKEAAKKEAASKPAKKKQEYWIQLGALSSSKALEKTWAGLKKKYSSQLGKLEYRSNAVKVAGKGTMLRLQAGPFAGEEKAAAVCKALKAKGQACLIVK